MQRTGASELQSKVEQHWGQVSGLPKAMYAYGRENVPAFRELAKWTDDEISAAVEVIRAHKDGEEEDEPAGYPTCAHRNGRSSPPANSRNPTTNSRCGATRTAFRLR